MSATSWSFLEEDYRKISRHLHALVQGTNARTTLLIDRNGQMIAQAGEDPQFDTTAFATLSAADFAANDQLASLIGEDDFSSLYHQGERESMYLSDIAKRVILVVLFDNRSTVGLVRLRSKQVVKELNSIFSHIFSQLDSRRATFQLGDEFATEAEDEIDNLFHD